ncbi:hypothetical protein DPSP01_011340 [Paraphaeosphaeria sporulosa]|uniref:DUF1294-domain-containing protein n=1 Tax=Paraphaeosphaeria sporulosa TaxID=1460663 RepID=A0A177CNC0_9PLEO|nr:DUF1294-domain-containing protein [Paraphaeosphaeria sporulosa]OAG08701.1 DUF1294-domain-containing protein [Paraphaeosphaeria sporulosa]
MPPRTRSHHRHRPITPLTFLAASSLILPILSLTRLYLRAHAILLTIFTVVLSLVTFLLYGYDKMQARNLNWRVKESTLHLCAVLGGWPGALAGMHYFQHKTRKVRFLIVFWGIVACWEGVWLGIWRADYGDWV